MFIIDNVCISVGIMNVMWVCNVTDLSLSLSLHLHGLPRWNLYHLLSAVTFVLITRFSNSPKVTSFICVEMKLHDRST